MNYQVLTSTENLPYEDWLEYRKHGIGGSDASVVCGINRYKSPVELWMEKTNQLPCQEAGEAAYWGTRLESIVRAEFTKRTGIEVELVKQLLQSTEKVLLFLLRPNTILPLLVRVPVTSKNRFLKYTTRLAGALTPINGVVTRITLERATSKGGKPFALFKFEVGSTLDMDTTMQAKTYAQQFMEIVNAADLTPELDEAS